MGYPDGSRSPGRQLVGIALVIILHVLIIYALTKGLPRKTVEIYWPPLEIKLIEESKPVPPKPDVP